MIVVGPATKQFSSTSAFPLRLPTKRRPALHGSQGMRSTDPISPRSVAVLRFTWVQVLPWGGGGDTIGRTDTMLSPGENGSSLGSPSPPALPRTRSWAPAGLSVWDRMEKAGACGQEATPDAKAQVSKPAPAVGRSGAHLAFTFLTLAMGAVSGDYWEAPLAHYLTRGRSSQSPMVALEGKSSTVFFQKGGNCWPTESAW